MRLPKSAVSSRTSASSSTSPIAFTFVCVSVSVTGSSAATVNASGQSAGARRCVAAWTSPSTAVEPSARVSVARKPGTSVRFLSGWTGDMFM